MSSTLAEWCHFAIGDVAENYRIIQIWFAQPWELKLGNYVFRRLFLCMQNRCLWTCAFPFQFHEISFSCVWSSGAIVFHAYYVVVRFPLMFFFWMCFCTSGSISSSFKVSHWIFCSPSSLDFKFQWCPDNVYPRKSERGYWTFSTWHLWFSSHFFEFAKIMKTCDY